MSIDGGGDAKSVAREILNNFTETGTILPELSLAAEEDVTNRVTPALMIRVAVLVIAHGRWSDGIPTAEILGGSVPSLSRKDLLTWSEASLGDVSAAKRAESEGLFSLLNSTRVLSALVTEESISAESLGRLFDLAEQLCLEFLGDGGVSRRGRGYGPWDVSEYAAPLVGLVDLGGVRVPAFEHMEIKAMETGSDTVAVTLKKGGTAIQLQAYITKGGESWDLFRLEMVNKLRAQGCAVNEFGGRAGLEIRASVPVEMGTGKSGIRKVKVIGCDGPGWFLRGFVSGAGAEPESRDEWPYEIFSGTVVVSTGPVCTHGDFVSLRLRVPGLA
ncbi:DUF3710 domain-containing protein [Streptomyces sp. NPDC058221]|uniref:DUF3710 domain-containing protein n=1 Tax=Streptomyces sp. NPDC058221 TaxID=3346388 RepID=UPI0036EF4035